MLKSNISKTSDVKLIGETLHVIGSLTYDSAVPLWKSGLQAITSLTTNNLIHINLEALSQSDSSGLAVWSSWVRAAERQKKKLRFINIPKFMQDLIKMHGLESILPT